MSATTFQAFIQQAFTAEQENFHASILPLYGQLESALVEARPGQKSQELVSYRFERLRLGLGIALMQILTDLGGDEDSAVVRDLLEEALQARNIPEIDATIQKKSHLFEELYTELYVNPEAEEILSLFEETLAANTKTEMDQILEKALDVTQHLEFPEDDESPTES